jgi:glutaredoxin-related protein
MAKKIFIIFLIFAGIILSSPIFAQTNPQGPEINFFYSETCPHCAAEQKFLNNIEVKYPDIQINRYLANESKNRKILIDLLKKHSAEKYLGLVPLTFVGDEFIAGFDNESGVGRKIEDSIIRQMAESPAAKTNEDEKKINLPFVGDVDLGKYSLPAQAVVLGFFDGFNICSLGALVLILGLVIILRSRKKILLFGGTFILTTVIIYGILIGLWYQLFYFLSPYLKIMDIFVGILGVMGGIYFLKQFLKYKKYGPACDMNNNNGLVNKFSSKIQKNFQESQGLWAILISVFIFAVVITVVEFPCSAVVPVLFAGILAKAQVSVGAYIFYIAIYLLFYMIDEIVVFLIAVFTMNIKIASSKAMTWLNLIEAIVLFGLGFYYLIGF